MAGQLSPPREHRKVTGAELAWIEQDLADTGTAIGWRRIATRRETWVYALGKFFILWVAVLVIGIATAAHQAFSANLYTLPSDLFPRAAVGSVIGIGGTVGAIGGVMMAKYAGFVLDGIGSYAPLFYVAGSAYLLALGAVHILSPGLERVATF